MPMPSNGPRVIVYTTDPCRWCLRAKELLEQRGVAYREEWIPRTQEGFAQLSARVPGARSFPQIVIDGEPIGGFQDLLDLARAGRLVEEVP
jgi:glutaredoxin 3